MALLIMLRSLTLSSIGSVDSFPVQFLLIDVVRNASIFVSQFIDFRPEFSIPVSIQRFSFPLSSTNAKLIRYQRSPFEESIYLLSSAPLRPSFYHLYASEDHEDHCCKVVLELRGKNEEGGCAAQGMLFPLSGDLIDAICE